MCLSLKVCFLALCLVVNDALFGQKLHFNDHSIDWDYRDFIKNNVTIVEGYEYKIKKGRIKKDSMLFFKRQLNVDSNMISGLDYNMGFPQAYRSTYLLKTYYNRDTLVIKETNNPLGLANYRSNGTFRQYTIRYSATTYKYDSLLRIISEFNQSFSDDYTIYRKARDTSNYLSVEATLYEIEYNAKGQKVTRYVTKDSTRYLSTRTYTPDTASVRCSYCYPRTKNDDCVYDNNGNVSYWTSYTKEGKIHTRKYFYYNQKNKLVKQVDSTGWYYKKQPFLAKTIEYKYKDTTLIEVTRLDFDIVNRKTVEWYENGNIIKECITSDSSEECTRYIYNFDNNRLASKISIGENKIETYFLYNPQNLLIEKKIIYNGELHELIRYYYR